MDMKISLAEDTANRKENRIPNIACQMREYSILIDVFHGR